MLLLAVDVAVVVVVVVAVVVIVVTERSGTQLAASLDSFVVVFSFFLFRGLPLSLSTSPR